MQNEERNRNFTSGRIRRVAATALAVGLVPVLLSGCSKKFRYGSPTAFLFLTWGEERLERLAEDFEDAMLDAALSAESESESEKAKRKRNAETESESEDDELDYDDDFYDRYIEEQKRKETSAVSDAGSYDYDDEAYPSDYYGANAGCESYSTGTTDAGSRNESFAGNSSDYSTGSESLGGASDSYAGSSNESYDYGQTKMPDSGYVQSSDGDWGSSGGWSGSPSDVDVAFGYGDGEW